MRELELKIKRFFYQWLMNFTFVKIICDAKRSSSVMREILPLKQEIKLCYIFWSIYLGYSDLYSYLNLEESMSNHSLCFTVAVIFLGLFVSSLSSGRGHKLVKTVGVWFAELFLDISQVSTGVIHASLEVIVACLESCRKIWASTMIEAGIMSIATGSKGVEVRSKNFA